MIMLFVFLFCIPLAHATVYINDNAVTHMGSGRCLPLAVRDYDYLISSDGDTVPFHEAAQPRRLASARMPPGALLAMTARHIVSWSGGRRVTINVTTLFGHEASFLTQEDLYTMAMKDDMGMSGVRGTIDIYRTPLAEPDTTDTLTFDVGVVAPEDVSVLGNTASWTDDGVVRLFDLARMTKVHHGIPRVPGVRHANPRVCDNVLYLNAVDVANRSKAMRKQLQEPSGAAMPIHPPRAAPSDQTFVASVWVYRDRCHAVIARSGAGGHSLSGGAAVGSYPPLTTIAVTGTGDVTSMDAVPLEWALRPTDVLVDVVGTAHYIFFSVCRAGECVIHISDLRRIPSLERISVTAVNATIRFVSALTSGVVYSENAPGRPRRVLVLSITIGDNNDVLKRFPYSFALCVLDGEGMMSAVTSFADVVMYSSHAGGGGVGALYRVDLDADNDGVIDVADRFPISSFRATWDLDNDDIPDESDIVPLDPESECARDILTRPGVCVDDYVILYLIWFFFLFVSTCVLLSICGVRRREIKRFLTTRTGVAVRVRHQSYEHSDTEILADLENNLEKYLHPVHDNAALLHVETAAYWFTVCLTLYAVALTVYPYWGVDAVTAREENIIAWMDFYVTTIFFQDVIARWTFRETHAQGEEPGQKGRIVRKGKGRANETVFHIQIIGKGSAVIAPIMCFHQKIVEDRDYVGVRVLVKGMKDGDKRLRVRSSVSIAPPRGWSTYVFLRTNWYDIPSLFTDIPGATTTGAGRILVLTRLMRILRILKVFRVWRLYRRVTHHSVWFYITTSRPLLFLGITFCAIILAISIVLKVVEQQNQPTWSNFDNVVWFSMVTVTTTGYGELAPLSATGRVLAIILMVLGIGLIGLFSASMSRWFLESTLNNHVGHIKQSRMDITMDTTKELALQSIPYNPLAALFDHLQIEMPEEMPRLLRSVRFESLEHEFPSHETLRNIAHEQHDDSKKVDVPVELQRRRSRQLHRMAKCYDRLALCVNSFITNKREPVSSPELLLQRLQQCIFSPGPVNGLPLEALFSIGAVQQEQTEHHSHGTIHPQMHEDYFHMMNTDIDWQDPHETILDRIEKIVDEHNVPRDALYHEFMDHLAIVAMMFERVESARWALRNLQVRPDAVLETSSLHRNHRGSATTLDTRGRLRRVSSLSAPAMDRARNNPPY